MSKKKSPVGEYRTIVSDSGEARYVNRLLVATPTTGLVRVEWVAARYGQIIPCNWSMVTINQFMDGFMPLRYQVADAQNLVVGEVIKGDFEWLLFIEHDVVPPPDAFVRINDYIREEKVPVVSGLYFTRSNPSEPLLYRGRGTSFYDKWKMGDLVWVDGVPTGFLLIHAGILREMWKDSPEYDLQGQVVRRVFETPRSLWFNPEKREFHSLAGTSDLQWCTSVMEGGYFKKAGWKKYQKKKWPFLVDTNIFCKHINPDGRQYP